MCTMWITGVLVLCLALAKSSKSFGVLVVQFVVDCDECPCGIWVYRHFGVHPLHWFRGRYGRVEPPLQPSAAWNHRVPPMLLGRIHSH
jgi:hypothetical protein